MPLGCLDHGIRIVASRTIRAVELLEHGEGRCRRGSDRSKSQRNHARSYFNVCFFYDVTFLNAESTVRSTKVPEMIWSQQYFHGDTNNSRWLTLPYGKDLVNAL
jgi:hypothetical protein